MVIDLINRPLAKGTTHGLHRGFEQTGLRIGQDAVTAITDRATTHGQSVPSRPYLAVRAR
jgi:hypothetical protein